MPMIEFRYKPGKISDVLAAVIGEKLEGALRFAISNIRKRRTEYTITVEGDRFGPIVHNQPDLRIHIFYHQEWEFSPNELDCLAAGMGTHVQCVFSELKLYRANAVIRFYSRAGHARVKIG